MASPEPCFFFDLVDPLSYLMDREIRSWERVHGRSVERIGLELRPPPQPMIDPDEPWWQDRWSQARRLAQEIGVELTEPPLVPWSRKAHELVLHAGEVERADEVTEGLFALAFETGADLGRVDVLATFARELGMDLSRAKAVLDVDRHAEEVARGRERAAALGVDEAPTLVAGNKVLRGFHNRDALGTFLG